MDFISTSDAPTPAGHYSQAVVHQGLVYVSGQLPIQPGQAPEAGMSREEQVEQVLANLGAVLAAAGSGPEGVLQLRVYVADTEMWPLVNEACIRFFGAHRPARAVIPCGVLRHGMLVELDAVACVLPA